MHRLLLILPLTACMHTPCPVPLSCVTPDDCVCLVTGAIDAPRGDGGQRVTPASTPPDVSEPPSKPDDNGKSSDGNGDHSNGASSDSNGDNSHE